ncbi:GMC oxidoreductase [Corallococcus terminator]
MDSVFFLTEEDWRLECGSEACDYVVIGSGPCGLAFAERTLRHDPHGRILMLEQGPFFLPDHVQNLPIPYQQVRGQLVETYPWTLSARTVAQPPGNIGFQHGMVSFFGGRSTMWSSWSPRPLRSELASWPAETVRAIEANLTDAERLLHVVPADQLDSDLEPATREKLSRHRPTYGVMQRELQSLLAARLDRVDSATRVLPAPLSVNTSDQEDLDFAKFSTPAPLLEIASHQAKLSETGEGSPLKIMTDCTVTRVRQQDGVATALETSRGLLRLGHAKVILAMGTLPPTTLIMNSFPQVRSAGVRYSAHFVSFVLARMLREDFAFADSLEEMELAAHYLAGVDEQTGMQYHIQLSALSDREPVRNSPRAAKYMPDLIATASARQLTGSQDHIVFTCAALGELDYRNRENWLRHDKQAEPPDNVTLQILANDTDHATWDTMDEAAFQLVERVLSPRGAAGVEYWNGTPSDGDWARGRPALEHRRMPGLVHEASTLWMGEDEEAVVDPDYRPRGVSNVYVTGGGLWPTGGSWNPTLTMVALAQDLADRLAALRLGRHRAVGRTVDCSEPRFRR